MFIVDISELMLSCLQTHRLISPRLYHARHKREIADTRDTSAEGRHVHHLTVAWDLDGEDFVLDLNLNRDLIPEKYFEKYHHQVSTERCQLQLSLWFCKFWRNFCVDKINCIIYPCATCNLL